MAGLEHVQAEVQVERGRYLEQRRQLRQPGARVLGLELFQRDQPAHAVELAVAQRGEQAEHEHQTRQPDQRVVGLREQLGRDGVAGAVDQRHIEERDGAGETQHGGGHRPPKQPPLAIDALVASVNRSGSFLLRVVLLHPCLPGNRGRKLCLAVIGRPSAAR